MTNKILKLRMAVAIVAISFIALFYYSRSFAQPDPPAVCIPYVPIVVNVSTGGHISATDGGCSSVSLSHNFGIPLAGEPIAALNGWQLTFGSERHFGQGSVNIMGLFISGTSVFMEVRGCLRDSDTAQVADWTASLTLAAWPLEEFRGFPP